MNFKFIIIALVFFLMPQVSEAMLLGNFSSDALLGTNENLENRLPEEEVEITSTLIEAKKIESGSSSGGAASFFESEKDFILQHCYLVFSASLKCEVFIPKSPKYIKYCSLKLHC